MKPPGPEVKARPFFVSELEPAATAAEASALAHAGRWFAWWGWVWCGQVVLEGVVTLLIQFPLPAWFVSVRPWRWISVGHKTLDAVLCVLALLGAAAMHSTRTGWTIRLRIRTYQVLIGAGLILVTIGLVASVGSLLSGGSWFMPWWAVDLRRLLSPVVALLVIIVGCLAVLKMNRVWMSELISPGRLKAIGWLGAAALIANTLNLRVIPSKIWTIGQDHGWEDSTIVMVTGVVSMIVGLAGVAWTCWVLWQLRQVRRTLRRMGETRCLKCGYDLRAAVGDRCPECGWTGEGTVA